MTFIGHREALGLLPRPMPPALLITGPAGIGKSLVAKTLAQKAGAEGSDLQVFRQFRVAEAGRMLDFHRTKPLSSKVKATVADITYGSPQAVNSILKLLEEVPESSRIILHADRLPLLTVTSRCTRLPLSPLHPDEVSYLLQRRGFSEDEADDLAGFSNGSMEVALKQASLGDSFSSVTTLLSAIGKGEHHAIDAAISSAMKNNKGEQPHETEARRLQRCEVLGIKVARSLQGSTEYPVLQKIGGTHRLRCLDVLREKSRPMLRYRKAALVLLNGVGR